MRRGVEVACVGVVKECYGVSHVARVAVSGEYGGGCGVGVTHDSTKRIVGECLQRCAALVSDDRR